jgi:hypothetical protein
MNLLQATKIVGREQAAREQVGRERLGAKGWA